MSTRGRLLSAGIMFFLLLFIASEARMENEKPFSGSPIVAWNQFRSDQNSNIYFIVTDTLPMRSIVYHVDPENMSAKQVFWLNSYAANITIGKSEFAFQKVYWSNPYSVELFQGFTTPISRTGVLNWTPRTAFQSFRSNYRDRCFYAGDRLLLERRMKNGNNKKDTTILYSIEDDSTLRELFILEECVIIEYESAIMAYREDADCYEIYDLANERFFHIAREADASNFPDIIISDNYLFISTNNKVTEYCLDAEEPVGTVILQDGKAPNICFSDGCIYIYSSSQHLLQQYSISQHAYVAEYSTSQLLPTHREFIVYGGYLIMRSQDDEYIYMYCLSDGSTSKIHLK